jgi:hypothetical protein
MSDLDRFSNDVLFRLNDLEARLKRVSGERPGNFTAGSVLFGGSGGRVAQDNANLFWDDTNNRLGVGTASPGYLSEFLKSDATVGRTGAIGAEIVVTNSSVANSVTQSGIRFRTSDAGVTTRSAARIIGSFLAGTYPDSALVFQTVSGSEIFQDVMTLRGVNVGIGTTAPAAKLDVTDGYIRALSGANNPPTSGTGVELLYAGGIGYVLSYDRTGAAYQPLRISGTPLLLNPGSLTSVGMPSSAGTAAFGIDATLVGSTLSIANNGTATPFSNAANFSGMIIVQDTTINGGTGLFIVGGNTVLMVGNTPANTMTHTATTASRVNVYSVAGVLTVENKLGSTATLRVFAIRTRTT